MWHFIFVKNIYKEMYKKKIVTLTSWPKRINNVATVVDSLLKQDIKPDIIQINLSQDEFKNKEDNLPKDLLLLLENNPTVHIEWVRGNDGVFKKIIPTLKKYYGEEYYLLSVDDDWIYRYDYIKMMINYLKEYESDSFCLANSNVIGNRMIYKSSIFEKDFWEKLTPEIISTRIDDSYIAHYMRSKKKKMACYRPSDVLDITQQFNPIFPNSHNELTGEYSFEEVNKAKEIIEKIVFE